MIIAIAWPRLLSFGLKGEHIHEIVGVKDLIRNT